MKIFFMRRFFFFSFLFIILTGFSFGQSAQSDAFFAQGIELYKAGKYKEAIAIFEKCDLIDKQELDPLSNRSRYAEVWIANCYYKLGDEEKAKSISANYKYPVDRRLTVQADELAEMALTYADRRDFAMALDYTCRSAEIEKSVLGGKHPAYVRSLNILARCYFELEDYSKAVEFGTQALQVEKETLGENHPGYATSLNNLATYYSYLGDYDKTVAFGMQALLIYKEVYGENHPYYAISLNNLARCYYFLGDYAKAVELGTQALRIVKEVLGENHPGYVLSLNNLTVYYSALGDYAKAVELCTQALQIQKDTSREKHSNYALSLSNLADYYYHSGNYTKAVELGIQALQIQKEALGENHSFYATFLNKLSLYYSQLGDYAKAVKLCTQALQTQKNHSEYAASLNNLADYYSKSGDYAKAVELCTQALQIQKEALGEKCPSYATFLGNLALYYCFLDDYTKAVELGTQALQIQKEILGEDHPSYATFLGNLALYYYFLDDYIKAVELGTQALQIQKEILGENHPDYVNSLNNLAGYCFYRKDWTNCIENHKHYQELFSEILRTNFQNLTARERNLYWMSRRGNESLGIIYSMGIPKDLPVGYEIAYNAALLSKGILLSSEIEFGKVIQESGDTALLRKFEEMRMARLQLNVWYQKPIAERPAEEVRRLEARADALEKELVKELKEFGDFTRNLTITWQDVQAALGERDVAVEFAVAELDSLKRHIALLLRKGWRSPKYVYIGTQKEIEQYLQQGNDLYFSQELSNKVWTKIIETGEVKEGENIWFSPDGEFHRIGVEYLTTPDGRHMFERYNMYRLSSTRQLVFDNPEILERSIALYGGIEYDSDTTTMSMLAQAFPKQEYAYNSTIGDSQDRGGFTSLAGTRQEVETISKLFTDKGIRPRLYMDTLATEESVKGLSGMRLSLLHIATHGFYNTEEEAEKNRMYRLLQLNSESVSIEDKSLTRSGLLFAGANNVFNSVSVPDNVDDGVLTAKEISLLDFRGLDLVVLSACETGLGKITGEGVFGLQRGFKKAGAQTLLMSLWKVDDTATQLLMSEFYRNLLAGTSKRTAFTKAQQYLRTYQNGEYDDPKYWAAFVMLDGMTN